LGDLYVLRIAGNTLSDILLAGIEYAVQYFSTPLCVVLGHTGCGAIQATYDYLKDPHQTLPSSNLKALVTLIGADKKIPKTPTDLAWENIHRNVNRIRTESPLLKTRVEQKKLKVVGAIYELAEGKVVFDSNVKSKRTL
jgi:carbonic anhydrase